MKENRNSSECGENNLSALRKSEEEQEVGMQCSQVMRKKQDGVVQGDLEIANAIA